jgi:hypothetical protein
MSVVTDEMVQAFLTKMWRDQWLSLTPKQKEQTINDTRAALAAVAPLIAAQERERCAVVADKRADEMYEIAASAQGEGDQERCERMTYRGNGAKSAAAAIRALGDET